MDNTTIEEILKETITHVATQGDVGAVAATLIGLGLADIDRMRREGKSPADSLLLFATIMLSLGEALHKQGIPIFES